MIRSKPSTDAYRQNFDSIFKNRIIKKRKAQQNKCPHKRVAWNPAQRIAVCVACGKEADSPEKLRGTSK
jgi:hypothetical protein